MEKHKDLANYLKNYFNDIPENMFSYREVIWRIKNEIKTRPVCPICGKPVLFKGEINLDKSGKTINGYRKHCCQDCRNKDKNVNLKREQTCLEKYNVKNVSYLKVKHEKVKQIKPVKLKFNNFIVKNNYHLQYSEKELQQEFNYFKTAKGTLLKQPNKNKIVKQFQQNIFFKEEFQLLNQKEVFDKLLENRKHFLHKETFTLDELLSGLKISGVAKGYSHFNPLWLKWFIEKYDIETLYDPCSGWGHHMLGALSIKHFHYNDFDTEVCQNVKNIIEKFYINNVTISNEDAKKYIPKEKFDAWFMCPPYYNLENYNNKHFKDLCDYENFLNGIIQIWKESPTEVLGIIIREDLQQLIKNLHQIEVFEIKGMHSYKFREKKYKEKFYIYKK